MDLRPRLYGSGLPADGMTLDTTLLSDGERLVVHLDGGLVPVRGEILRHLLDGYDDGLVLVLLHPGARLVITAADGVCIDPACDLRLGNAVVIGRAWLGPAGEVRLGLGAPVPWRRWHGWDDHPCPSEMYIEWTRTQAEHVSVRLQAGDQDICAQADADSHSGSTGVSPGIRGALGARAGGAA